MDQESLWNDFRALPPSARQEVTDFIAFLRTRYVQQSSRRSSGGPLKAEPFIGMWADRADMSNATDWVRALRTTEWQPDHE